MLSFIKRVSGFGPRESPAAVQPAVNPAKAHVVVSELDDCEDGYAQVSVRPMTYAEVASQGIVTRVQPLNPPRKATPKTKPAALTESASVVQRQAKSVDAESDDLYGDLAEEVFRPRRKGFKRSRTRTYV